MSKGKSISKKLSQQSSKDYYFDSYAHFGIHEEMLKDTIRTLSYYDAITYNKDDFKDKVILDVGCGTGILSLFAAKAGAKKVIGVDFSNIVHQAKQIVKDNKFDHVITILQGKIEDVELPVKEVDVIISEWMGYFLVYESMLESVLYARNKYLKKTGIMYPNISRLFICGIEDKDYKNEKIHFWDNVYGFDFKCIKEVALLEPLVDGVDKDQIITTSCKILELDVGKCTVEDTKFFTSDFVITAKYDETVHALVSYFDIIFDGTNKDVYFTTSPFGKYTHWRQTIFYLKKDIRMRKGEKLKGKITCNQNKKNNRDWDIIISIDFSGIFCNVKLEQHYVLK